MTSAQPASATVFFVAYPSHASLRADIQRLIANLDSGSREPQKALAARAMETAAREVLQVMVGDLVTRLQNPARPHAETGRTIDRIDDYIGTFCKLLAGVLSNDKLTVVMRHFRTVLMDVDDAQGVAQPWVGFRVDTAFATELRAVCAHLRDEQATYDAARAMAMLDRLTDVVLREFLEVPKDLMNFGFVMRKTADGGLAMIRSAMHGMMHRAIPHLSPRRRRALADHLEVLLLELPADRYA